MQKRNNKSRTPLLGAHFSVSGGLHKAVETAEKLGCPVLQIFTKNSRTWKESLPAKARIQAFANAVKKADIRYTISHCSYLINIASDDPEKLEKSLHALKSELARSALLGIDYVVLHPGAFMSLDESCGIRTAARTLKLALEERNNRTPRLLLETTAGQGTQLGHTFEQLAQIMEQTGMPEHTGICLDTSHIFAAGYDLRTLDTYIDTFLRFDRLIGKDRLFAIHLNDSKTGLGSKKDRHEHIGLGRIGLDAFSFIMNDKSLSHIPKILETPKYKGTREMDPVNLKTLRNLTGNSLLEA